MPSYRPLLKRAFAVFVLVTLCGAAADAINPFAKIKQSLKRRAIKKQLYNGDIEAQADEILSYNTACDQQLAKSMIILEKQKSSSESALEVCERQRETFHGDIRWLENKLAVADDSLQEKEKEFSMKMEALQKGADSQADEAEARRTEQEKEMKVLVNHHANELRILEEAKKAETEQIMNEHSLEIQRLEKGHQNTIAILQQQIANLRQEKQEDQEKARKNLEKVKSMHERHVITLEKEWSLRLARAEADATKKLDEVETFANQKEGILSGKLSTCTKELGAMENAKKRLNAKYDRALEEIASWEDVFGKRQYCNFTYVIEDATLLLNHTGDKLLAELDPIYDKYAKGTVEKIRPVAQRMRAVLEPVRKQLEKLGRDLMKEHQKMSAQVHGKIKNAFVQTTCPRVKASLKELRSQKGLHSPAVNKTIRKACSEPDEFLAFTSKTLLLLFVLLFRRFLFRAALSLLFLPFKIMALPFTFLMTRKSEKSPPQPSSS